MPRILVVEDDPAIAGPLVERLSAAGFRVDCASTGRSALALAVQGRLDLVVLDRMLPDLDGLAALRALRTAEVRAPVLVLSALGAVDERIEGLRAGADDYLAKPFSMDELLARVEVLLRRSAAPARGEVLACADLSLDLGRLIAARGGRTLALTRREIQILRLLLENEGRVVTRSMLLDAVWGYRTDHDPNVIEVHVSRLRGKLHGEGEAPLLHTVRGTGYVLGATPRP